MIAAATRPPARRKPSEAATEALDLRVEGRTYAEIADELGLASPDAARKAVKAGHARVGQDPDEARRLDVERCDRLIDRNMPRALSGDRDAGLVALAAMRHKAKLLGLEKLNVDHGGEVTIRVEYADDVLHHGPRPPSDDPPD